MTILDDLTAAIAKVQHIYETRPLMLVHPDDYEVARAYVVGDIARLMELDKSPHVKPGQALVMRRDLESPAVSFNVPAAT